MLGGNPVDGAHGLALDKDDPLVAPSYLFQITLNDEGFAKRPHEHFQQRGEISVALLEMKDAGTTIAIERLDDDVAVLLAEIVDLARIPGDERFGHQIRELGDKDLFGTVAHPGRIVDDQCLGVNPVKDVGGGDIVHVEGRVLTQKNHVHLRQIEPLRLAQCEMIALDIAHFQRFRPGDDLAIDHGKLVRRVVPERMAPSLRFQRERKARVAGNRNGGDMVHLDRDFEGHEINSGGT